MMYSVGASASKLGMHCSDDLDRESTIASSDGPFHDASSNTGTGTIDLLSGDESDFGEDRKPSPAPSFDSDDDIEVIDVVRRGSPPPPSAFEDTKPKFEDTKPKFEDTKPARGRGAPRGPTQRLTEAMQAQIVSLREAGWTNKAIGEHIDRSPNTVNSFLRSRKKRIEALISDLPGSRPIKGLPAAGRSRVAKQEDVKPNVRLSVPTPRARATTKRERDTGAAFGFDQEDLLDVKPGKRPKKEEPFYVSKGTTGRESIASS